MDEELRSVTERLRQESGGSAAFDALLATGDLDELAEVLTAPGQPLWARELAAFRLGRAGDRRAFESLVLLLNHRDPPRCAGAAHALARLEASLRQRPAVVGAVLSLSEPDEPSLLP